MYVVIRRTASFILTLLTLLTLIHTCTFPRIFHKYPDAASQNVLAFLISITFDVKYSYE